MPASAGDDYRVGAGDEIGLRGRRPPLMGGSVVARAACCGPPPEMGHNRDLAETNGTQPGQSWDAAGTDGAEMGLNRAELQPGHSRHTGTQSGPGHKCDTAGANGTQPGQNGQADTTGGMFAVPADVFKSQRSSDSVSDLAVIEAPQPIWHVTPESAGRRRRQGGGLSCST